MDELIEKKFALAEDMIDPKRVPSFQLSDGTSMPCIGYGTFGSDHVSPHDVAEGVKMAISLGYRQLDCARAYGNEKEIGHALNDIFQSGAVKREDIHITSKLWNDRHQEREVLVSCAETLRDLRIDYLDLYLVHWPFPNYHRPGCVPGERDPHARPFFEENYMMVWRQMERLVDLGFVKSIGMSNMTKAKIDSVWSQMRIKPVVNEMELHPHLQQNELITYLKSRSILPIAHTPLGSPNRPDRDRTPEDTNVLEDPEIINIAKSHGIHPVTVCIKWAVQRGTVPVPFSVSRNHVKSNLKCCIEDPLTDGEMREIARLATECRLIKGSVLLWPNAPDWRCLWDLNGEIDRTGWGD